MKYHVLKRTQYFKIKRQCKLMEFYSKILQTNFLQKDLFYIKTNGKFGLEMKMKGKKKEEKR